MNFVKNNFKNTFIITGKNCTGKTTLLNLLNSDKNNFVINSDILVKKIIKNNKNVKEFFNNFYKKNNLYENNDNLNLIKFYLNNINELKEMEDYLYPFFYKKLEQILFKSNTEKNVFIEFPLNYKNYELIKKSNAIVIYLKSSTKQREFRLMNFKKENMKYSKILTALSNLNSPKNVKFNNKLLIINTNKFTIEKIHLKILQFVNKINNTI